eukprot:5429602-Karenia_brevis.AAC.1
MLWAQIPATLKGEGRLDLLGGETTLIDTHGSMCLIQGKVFNRTVGIALLQARNMLVKGYID